MFKIIQTKLGRGLLIVTVIALSSQFFSLSTVKARVANFDPVTLCHQEGNGNYNEITVSTEGALNGHQGHEGDIIPAPIKGCKQDHEGDDEEDGLADLQMFKGVDEPLPDIGGLITYGLKVTNNGPDKAKNVKVVDVLPSGLTFLSADPTENYDNNTGIWTVGDLEDGASSTLDIYAQTKVEAGDTSPINTATVSSDTEDPNLDNNSASVQIDIGIPATCESGYAYANQLIEANQGTLKSGNPITDPTRTNANYMMGFSDDAFWSIGQGGSAVVGFVGYGIDVPGNDIRIHEITFQRTDYPVENADVYISQEGTTWTKVGTASSLSPNGLSDINIHDSGLSWFKYIKITDANNWSLHTGTADGFDVDSIKMYHRECSNVVLEKTGSYNAELGKLTYQINWKVTGNGQVFNLNISDPLPPGTTYVAESADNGGVYDSGSSTVSWDLGAKSGGENGTVSFMVTVDSLLGFNGWASTVVDSNQGFKADLVTPVDPVRSDATQVLGPAESAGLAFDDPIAPLIGKFYALGFKNGEENGSITVSFDHPAINGPGDDVRLFEITGGTSYPNETVRVYGSNDNLSWTILGTVTRDGSIDFGTMDSVKYIKITGISSISNFTSDADEYDLDAVQVLHPYAQECEIVNTARVSYTVGEGIEVLSLNSAADVKLVINANKCEQDPGGSGDGGGENPKGSITGVVFSDTNSDGVKDPGDSALSGWTVFIDANDNGTLDGGEVSLVTTSNYSFTNLSDGTYVIREVLQSGWTQTGPAGNKYTVIISSANNVTNKDFGNHQTEGNSGGGGSNGGGGSSSGGGGEAVLIPNLTPTPQVLGATAPVAGLPMPEVGGAATELPRTGAGALALILPLLFGLSGIGWKKRIVR